MQHSFIIVNVGSNLHSGPVCTNWNIFKNLILALLSNNRKKKWDDAWIRGGFLRSVGQRSLDDIFCTWCSALMLSYLFRSVVFLRNVVCEQKRLGGVRRTGDWDNDCVVVLQMNLGGELQWQFCFEMFYASQNSSVFFSPLKSLWGQKNVKTAALAPGGGKSNIYCGYGMMHIRWCSFGVSGVSFF